MSLKQRIEKLENPREGKLVDFTPFFDRLGLERGNRRVMLDPREVFSELVRLDEEKRATENDSLLSL